jgi:hypothetical protein
MTTEEALSIEGIPGNPARQAPMSTLQIDRSWLLRRFSLQYDLTLPLEPSDLSLLIDGVLSRLGGQILPRLDGDVPGTSLSVRNIKGRDRNNFIAAALSPDESSVNNELFFISGVTFHQVEEGDTPETQPFTWRISTPFRAFVAGGGIEHALEFERIGEVPLEIPFSQLGRIFPLRPLRFRCGLDVYSKSRLAGWFGGTPTVTQTLLIEADEKSLQLRITAEELSSADEALLGAFSIFANLCILLRDVAGFDLAGDLKKRGIAK